MSEPSVDLANEIVEQYRSLLGHKMQIQLHSKWDEYERFYEGEQWGSVAEGTEDLPRPVSNIIQEICDNKVAAVLSAKPSITFVARESTEDIRKANILNAQATYTWETTEMDDVMDAVIPTTAILGTGIIHSYWDPNITGGTSERGTAYKGDIVNEEIEPRLFFPGNPREYRVQRQPYIIVAERMLVDQARELFDDHQIEPDPEGEFPTGATAEAEYSRGEYVTIIHRWKRSSVGSTGRKQLDYAVVANSRVIKEEKPLYKHGLYPFVAFRWKRKRRSFWGISEVATLLSEQKEYNQLSAMLLLSMMYTALPQRRVKPHFVDLNTATTHPAQVIVDRTPGNAWSVDYLQPPAIPQYVLDRLNRLPNHMRYRAGMHPPFVGAPPSSQLNYSAIVSLQQAAGVPVNVIILRVYRSLRELARLWYEYWREFYVTDRIVRVVGANYSVEEFQFFKRDDFRGVEFDVVIEPSPWSPFNMAMLMDTLDNLANKGLIEPDEYLELLPKQVFPYADRILQKHRERAMQAQAQPPVGGGGPVPTLAGFEELLGGM